MLDGYVQAREVVETGPGSLTLARSNPGERRVAAPSVRLQVYRSYRAPSAVTPPLSQTPRL
jgi:hypothetical protein